MPMINILIVVALGSLTIGLSYMGVSQYSKWAIKKEILDIPNQRSSHTEPVPRGGGLVIVAITLGGLLIYQILNCCGSWKMVLGFLMGHPVRSPQFGRRYRHDNHRILGYGKVPRYWANSPWSSWVASYLHLDCGSD